MWHHSTKHTVNGALASSLLPGAPKCPLAPLGKGRGGLMKPCLLDPLVSFTVLWVLALAPSVPAVGRLHSKIFLFINSLILWRENFN